MKRKGFKFELKAVSDEGTFEGLLSVYNVVDLGGDLVEPGAFTKTISERGDEVPLLWQHDAKQPIGILKLEDSPDALKVSGRLVLEVEKAREAHALMKAGVVKGLSIGYDTVRSVMDKGVRRLKELRLWEGSAVTFPMCEPATISAVKADEEKADFNTALEDIQTWSLRYQMMNALHESLDSIIYDRNLSTEERTTQIAASIDQFRERYLDFLPRWFALMEAYKSLDDLLEQKTAPLSGKAKVNVKKAKASLKSAIEMHQAHMDGTEPTTEESQKKMMGMMMDAYKALGGTMGADGMMKAGRRISAETRSQIQEAITKLSALLEDSAGDDATEDKGAAVQEPQTPDDVHLWLSELNSQIKGVFANAN
jgi:HK97 family phage prohead protease